MRLSNRRLDRSHEIELSMTSMIDVVFLLLIFFMTTSSFVMTERNLDSEIKLEESQTSSAPSDLEPAIVDVIRSGERFVYRIGGLELETGQELTEILRQFPDKLQGAFVRVSEEAPFHMAAAAVQACKSANFTIVSYVPLD